MLKMIVLFRGGAKGDLLCNFINDKLHYNNLNQNLLFDGNDSFKTLESLLDTTPEKIIIPKLKSFVKNFKLPITNSHKLHKFSKSFVEELGKDYKLVCIDISGFENQVLIDLTLKTAAKKANFFKQMYVNSLGIKTKIEYIIDPSILIQTKKELNNKNRIDYIKTHRLGYVNNVLPMLIPYPELFEFIHYRDLFLPPYSGMIKLLKFFNQESKISLWPDAVEKSYLPKVVNLFGEDFYPADYGYKWHYEDKE